MARVALSIQPRPARPPALPGVPSPRCLPCSQPGKGGAGRPGPIKAGAHLHISQQPLRRESAESPWPRPATCSSAPPAGPGWRCCSTCPQPALCSPEWPGVGRACGPVPSGRPVLGPLPRVAFGSRRFQFLVDLGSAPRQLAAVDASPPFRVVWGVLTGLSERTPVVQCPGQCRGHSRPGQQCGASTCRLLPTHRCPDPGHTALAHQLPWNPPDTRPSPRPRSSSGSPVVWT